MVRFNNKQMKIYDLDTEDSIFSRLSSILNTDVELLYFPDGVPTAKELYEDKNIEVVDLKSIIENAENLTYIYNYIYKINEEENNEENEENEEEKLKNDYMLKNLTMYNLVTLYITFNKNIEETAQNELIYPGFFKDEKIKSIFNEANKLVKKSIDLNQIKDIWLRRNGIKESFEHKIESNYNDWIDDNVKFPKNTLSYFKHFQNEKELSFTEFEKQKVKFEIDIKINNFLSILEIFNELKLNEDIPFVVTHSFYKIYKDFIPPLEWTNLFDRSKTFYDKYKNINRNDTIILKVLENKKKNIYSESFIEIFEDKLTIKLQYNISNIKEKYINYENYNEILVSKILNLFNFRKNDIIDERITEVNGLFYFPLESIDKYVLSDLILNDNLFSRLLSINEKKISKKDSVYIYFENTKIGKIAATITPKIADDIDFMRNKGLFPKNSEYIRVKINKADNIEKVKYFQSIFSKLLNIYKKKEDEITQFYSPYVKINIKKEMEEEDDKKEKLENIEPELFLTGFSSDICQKKTQPTIINNEEAEELLKDKENEKFIIKFPKEETVDIIPRYYKCNTTQYPYPGLKKNKLENNDDFPYLPCCYPVEQTNKKNFRNYYFEEEIVDTKNKIQNIYKTRRIMEEGSFGVLPENINKVFSIVDRTGIYYRKGVERTKSSFLSCLLSAFNKSTTNLRRVRDKMATREFAASCKQELFDCNIDEIIKKIKDENEYLDPKLFLHLLETYFNCNIFLFIPDDNGKLILPRHIKGYYKNKNKNDCVFIYEHMGGSLDKAEYPQCELIVRQKDEKTEEIEELFDNSSIISKNVINIFNKVNTNYILDKKIPFISFDWPLENVIGISQNIDPYGKTRSINLNFDNNIITILTTPIQPLKLDVSNEIYYTNIHVALRLVKELKIKNLKQTIDDELNIKEINGLIDNTSITILLDGNDKKLDDIDISESKTYMKNFKETKSLINDYNKLKKISRYIIEYVFWLFSKFLQDNNIRIQDINGEVYKNFKNEYIKLDNNFVYENIPKTFSLEDSGIINDKKVVIKSEDALKRVFYVLRLELVRNSKKLLSFYKNSMIENYYIDITDFDYYSYQIILEGENSISKLIEEKNDKNIIYDTVHFNEDKKEEKDEKDEDEDEEDVEDEEIDKNQKEKNDFDKYWNLKPYFFKNSLINMNNIYLAQNIDSYMKAIEIATTWENKNYNPGANVKETDILQEFTLYSFINNKNIKKYNVDGNKNTYNIEILGYKVNFDNKKKNLYTVLLPL
jgi:hypothetical protein